MLTRATRNSPRAESPKKKKNDIDMARYRKRNRYAARIRKEKPNACVTEKAMREIDEKLFLV